MQCMLSTNAFFLVTRQVHPLGTRAVERTISIDTSVRATVSILTALIYI